MGRACVTLGRFRRFNAVSSIQSPSPPSSNPGAPIVVLVIETNLSLATHLRGLLAQHPHDITVRSASLTERNPSDPNASVVLVATNTPSPELASRWPESRVVVFSDSEDETAILQVLGGNAAGYLHTDLSSEELLAAVRRVANGQTVVDLGTGGRIAVGLAQARAGQTALLDGWALRPRERQVLESLLDGRTNREIAQDLHLGEETVKTYLRSLYRKLGARDRAQAIAITLRSRHN
jgi:DNA-binding NarL/FixJ family response regulator